MIVKNPTDKDISVSIQGVDYTLPAEGELKGIPEEHAEYWKVYLHNFIIVEVESKEKDITLKSAKVVEEKEVKPKEVKEAKEDKKTK